MKSGVKIDNHKHMSISEHLIEFDKPEHVYIPLVSYGGVECESLVKPGDVVLKGTIVGRRKDDIELPIHSTVSGKVLGIEEKLYLSGELVKCIAIQNDYHEKQDNPHGVKSKISSYSKEEFVELLKTCSVTGMGGSDFPTYVKYKTDLDTIVINAVECEPYITCDYALIMLKIEQILEAIDAIMEINNMSKGVIAIKEGNSALVKKIERYLGTYPNISLVTVRNVYPMGWEKLLISEVLGINYEKFPGEKGIVVNNVSTIFAIYKALKQRKPINRRIITISGGMIKKPQNVIVKLGTPIRDVIEEIGGHKKGDEVKFVAGGPMMGDALDSDELIVTKNLNCVLVLEEGERDIPITCLRCGRCSYVCPARLAPVLIRDKANDYEELKHLHPEKCIECGLCSYICPSKIDVREAVKDAKKEIRRN